MVTTIQVILKMAAETNQRALQIAVYLHTIIQAIKRIGSRHTQIHSVPHITASSTPVLPSATSFSTSYLRWQTQYQKAKKNLMLNRWTLIPGTVKLGCSPMRQPTTTISLTPMGRYPSLMTWHSRTERWAKRSSQRVMDPKDCRILKNWRRQGKGGFYTQRNGLSPIHASMPC